MPIVEAHPHIYSPDRDAYPTIDEPWEPGEPASADDLRKMMDVVGVDRAVFIQTSTFYGHDNRYIMESAKQLPRDRRTAPPPLRRRTDPQVLAGPRSNRAERGF